MTFAKLQPRSTSPGTIHLRPSWKKPPGRLLRSSPTIT
ncbi:hypothetical protein E2C01_097863 [Portunus trituberculatus]|uniref:Uncharacterized protein n=1 Tax=Portunus trituberculatus TaxID=210409 RepID=A0A5B7KAL9_PORTR|nr:hypothetical protein [Portunus trituberculatus]